MYQIVLLPLVYWKEKIINKIKQLRSSYAPSSNFVLVFNAALELSQNIIYFLCMAMTESVFSNEQILL